MYGSRGSGHIATPCSSGRAEVLKKGGNAVDAAIATAAASQWWANIERTGQRCFRYSLEGRRSPRDQRERMGAERHPWRPSSPEGGRHPPRLGAVTIPGPWQHGASFPERWGRCLVRVPPGGGVSQRGTPCRSLQRTTGRSPGQSTSLTS